jgi:hypothetical protein
LAVALVAKTKTDKVPLWAIVLAAYGNDVLKIGFKAIGLEQNGSGYVNIKRGINISIPANIPWSHGLLMTVVWSALAAVIVYLIYRDRRSAGIIGLVVISHWFIDVLVHSPELPLLFNGSPLVGLGLWSTLQGKVIASFLEVGMLVGGLALYLIHRKRRAVLVDKKKE